MPRIAQRSAVVFTCFVFFVAALAARPLPPVYSSQMQHGAHLRPAARAAARALWRAPIGGARVKLALVPARGTARQPTALLLEARAALGVALAELPVIPPRIPGDGPRMAGTLVAQTQRVDLYVGRHTFTAEQVAALAPTIEQLLRENEERFGTRLGRRVSLGFYRPALAPGAGIRGMAYTDVGRAELFYRPGESLDRAAVVAAHELGHHLEVARYGQEVQRRADTVLHEGLATWMVGEHWLAACSQATSWRQRARQLRDAGVPLRLNTAERYGANKAYELWASFVDFLVERYGWAAFDELYASGRGRAPGSADYAGVLGKPLDDVADEWRAWVGE